MEINRVTLYSSDMSRSFLLSFRDIRSKNPYQIKTIVGLDADEITVRYSGGDSTNKFYNLSPPKRDVVLRIGLNPYGNKEEISSYSELRDDLYKFIASDRNGEVIIHFGNGPEGVATLSGFVTKFEASHFSKDPEVQITISCQDPVLRGIIINHVDVSDLDPLNTIIDDDISTSPHGLIMAVDFTANAPSLIISDGTPETWRFELTPSGGFAIGDRVYITNEVGNRSVERTLPTAKPLADAIKPWSAWPMLFPGPNKFKLSTGVTWAEITYKNSFWGV